MIADTFTPYQCYPTGTAANILYVEELASKYCTKLVNKEASHVVCGILDGGCGEATQLLEGGATSSGTRAAVNPFSSDLLSKGHPMATINGMNFFWCAR